MQLDESGQSLDYVRRQLRRSVPDILSQSERTAIARALDLAPREAELLWASFYDESSKGMSERLGISVSTVCTYRDRLFKRLGAHSLAQVLSIVFALYLDAKERKDDEIK